MSRFLYGQFQSVDGTSSCDEEAGKLERTNNPKNAELMSKPVDNTNMIC